MGCDAITFHPLDRLFVLFLKIGTFEELISSSGSYADLLRSFSDDDEDINELDGNVLHFKILTIVSVRWQVDEKYNHIYLFLLQRARNERGSLKLHQI